MRLARRVISTVLLISMLLCNFFVPVNFAVADTDSNDIVLLSKGSTWKYIDDGSNQGTAWREPAFDDSAWKSGLAPLGYPSSETNSLNGTIKTVIGYGSDENNKYPTSYFRKTFTVSDLSEVSNNGSILAGIDDAAVIYLNGHEIARTNLPSKSDVPEIGFDKYVSDFGTGLNDATEKASLTFTLGAAEMSYLVEGMNVLAAEVHQGRADSSDVYWDMEFVAINSGGSGGDGSNYAATNITLAPGKNATELNFAWYSNVVTTSSAIQVALNDDMSGIEFPADKATTFTGTTSSAITGFFSNKVTATGLQESTEYVYRVGDGSEANWSPVYNFTTRGTDSYSFLAVGDVQIGSSGSTTSDTNGWKDTMSKALAQFSDVSFLLSLGDQVESNSNEAEYTGFFAPPELRSLPVAPLVGNHDNGAPNYSYHFNLSNLSSQYGVTTNTSSDYYFTYGNTLIMVLNSNNTSGATHEAFIGETVAANPDATWKVAMFHHDIYGSGGHAAETGIKNLRQALFPVFDQYDVDLVLTGHDHSYTRTYQMYNDQPLKGQNSIGTVYMTLNSGSGSKYYDLQATPETYAAVREQIHVPTFSKYDVTDNTLTISTYRTDTMALTDTYTIEKEAQEALDLAEVTTTADGDTLDSGVASDSISLSVLAIDSEGDAVDLSSAYVLYKTAEPDILSVATDGKVTVKNAPAMNETVKVWAEVYNGSEFVKSNELDVNVTVPYGLAGVTLTANGTSISATSSASVKLSLTGIDTTGANMSLSSATVEYMTDKADILAILADGTVTVQNAPERNTNVIITAEVTVDGKKVTSNALTLTVTTGSGTEIIVPVQNALDDIEERADGTLDYDSSDLEIVKEKPADATSQLIGIRFVDLAIPKGATITDAYIQFSVDEVNKDIDPYNVHIHAEDVDHSEPFIEDGQDPSLATNVVSDKYVDRIAESVEWKDAPSWTTEHEAGTAEQTPNLATLVQKIVNKTGWSSGNAMTFFLSGEGRRIAESFDGSGSDSEKPTLHVNYAEVDSSISISSARAQAAGTTATVTGIVTCVNPTTDGSYFIQDETAGICIYNTSLSPAPQLGDKIQATGVLGPYKGLLEIMPGSSADVIIKSSGNSIPEPRVETLATYQNYQSQLVKIKNVTLGTINIGGSTTVTDDSGSSVIYKIPELTGISAGDKVDIIAISAAYNSPQLIVPSAADIIKSSGTILAAKNLGAGQTAEVSGVVTYVSGSTYYIQDSTAGLLVYASGLSPAPQQGDLIQLTGPLVLYHGLLEMTSAAADVSILSSGNTLTDPTAVTIPQVKDEIQNYESQRVKIDNVSLGTTVNNYTPLTDGDGNTINIYKMPSLTGINVGDTVNVIAVASIYDNPQLLVQKASDITKGLSAKDKVFDIIAITDLHGNIGDTSTNQIAAVLAENIKNNVYANNPDRTLILANGDNYQGTAISNLQYGEPVMEIFNYMGVVASALGNHEFDWGLDKVTDISHPTTAQYPIICANLFPKGNTSDPVFDPYKIFTLDGVKIAVVGGITESTPNIVAAGSIEDYDVLSNVTYINKYTQEAKAAGAQIVIALIHEGDDYSNGVSGPIVDIAKNLVDVDAVLGGHTHDIVSTTVTTNSGKSIPLAIGNCNGKGYIDLKAILHEDGSLTFANANAAYVAQDTTSTVYPYGYKATNPTVDLNVKQIIADTMTEEGPILGEVLGSAQKTMTRTQVVSPYGESLAGNWATDVMRSESNTDFAFQNNGGLRCEIPQGEINMSLIYQFMPFDNVIMTCDMTGAQLKVILEEAVADGGMGIQISGLNFSYDSSKPSGSKVHSITKTDGTPVNLNDTTTTYKVATNDFLAGGTTAIPKDGFSFASQSSNMTDTHILVRDALADAVRAAGTTGITASIESRIKNQPTEDEPKVTQLGMDFEKQIVEVGGKAIVTLSAIAAVDLYGFDLSLKYDPTLFEYESVTSKPEFDLGEAGVAYDAEGNIHVIGVLKGQSTGLDGDLDLVTVKFKAKNLDALSNLTLLNGSQIAYGDLDLFTLEQDLVEKVAIANSDVTKNSKLELNDLVMMAKLFGVEQTDTGYQAAIDMNKDGVIDIEDIAYVAKVLLGR